MNHVDEPLGVPDVLLHLRRLRSFVFLLGLDFFYTIMLQVVRMTAHRQESAAHAAMYRNEPPLMLAAAYLFVDLLGIWAATRRSLKGLSFFLFAMWGLIVFQIIRYSFHPTLIIHFILAVIGAQVRQGVFMHESDGPFLDLFAEPEIDDGPITRRRHGRGRRDVIYV